ncbi:MAG: Cu(I)-responsive transcriptional regulator [Hyphomicrobiales bacterium]|nr:MAG: Cu(I)-responsive transcriptional regulator [Hyphomicrobiales bacterium]
MNIGMVASESGLPAKTIRYYEDIGLITPSRLENGYRSYNQQDAEKLRFLQRARSLGFSIEDCRKLLSLYEDKNRASADVKAVARKHLGKVEQKIRELESLRGTLNELVKCCHGDDRPDCPIINDLTGKEA